MTKKTFSVLTTVLLEHNYINYFVEYHINLGFDKIYILIDNSTTLQDEYIIYNEEYKKKIEFFDIRDYSDESDLCLLENCTHKSAYVHKILQKIYRIKMVEDYTILLGIDSFLFLNNLTIQSFFEKYKIGEDISQIFFKWINIFNHTYNSEYNLLDNINSPNKIKNYNYHYFTLGNRKLVINPSGNSHHYDLNENRNGWFNNSIYNIDKNDNFNTILNKIGNDTNEENTKIGCIYHFMMRDIIDLFVKSYYYWNNKSSNDIKRNIIRNIILNNSEFIDRLTFVNTKNHDSIKTTEVFLNVNNKESTNTNIIILNKLLQDCDISIEDFNNWIKKNNYTI